MKLLLLRNILNVHCHWREHKLYSWKRREKAKTKIIPKYANFFSHNYYKASATEFVYTLNITKYNCSLIFNMFCSMNLRHRTNVEQTNGKLQFRSRVFVLLAPWNVLQHVGVFLAFSLAVTLLWVQKWMKPRGNAFSRDVAQWWLMKNRRQRVNTWGAIAPVFNVSGLYLKGTLLLMFSNYSSMLLQCIPIV